VSWTIAFIGVSASDYLVARPSGLPGRFTSSVSPLVALIGWRMIVF
jgi:hypothetical protein